MLKDIKVNRHLLTIQTAVRKKELFDLLDFVDRLTKSQHWVDLMKKEGKEKLEEIAEVNQILAQGIKEQTTLDRCF